MTNINASFPISLSAVKRLDAAPLSIAKLPKEMAANFEQIWKDQFRIPVGARDNDPKNVYATVRVNGNVIATLYNSGCATTSNADYAKVRTLPSMGEGESLTGPALAQKRADEIAKALGGKVVKASTAQTAAKWHPIEPKWTYDYEAMEIARKAREALLGRNLW